SDQGERTEEATTQRREDFRKRGQVAQTRELGSVFVMFSSLAMIWLLGRFLFEQVNSIIQLSYGEGLVAAGRGAGNWTAAGRFAIEKMLFMLAPVFGISFLVSIASTALQTGFLYNEEALQFRPDRLDPIQGFGRIFSLKALIEGFKAMIKLCVILGL